MGRERSTGATECKSGHARGRGDRLVDFMKRSPAPGVGGFAGLHFVQASLERLMAFG